MHSSGAPSVAYRLAILAVLAILVASSVPVAAQSSQPPSGALLTPLALGDNAIGQALQLVQAPLRFIDGDVNGVPTTDEPAYWDLDDSNSVSVGDLRLRAFRTHPAGAAVAVTDNDAGRLLTGSAAWFGAASGAWYADLDASRSVTVGDVRMADAISVVAGASDLGRGLDFPASGATPGRAAIADTDHDQRWDRGEAVYLDLDTASSPSQPTVSAGDLRLAARSAAASDPSVTNGSASGAAGPGGAEDPDGAGGADRGDASGSGGDGGWRAIDTILLLLALVNLVGLVFVYTRLRDGAPPRNPFK